MTNRKTVIARAIIVMVVIAGLVVTGVLMALGSLGEVTRGLLLGESKLGVPVDRPLILQTMDRSEVVIVLEGRVLRQPNADPLLSRE